MSYEQEQDFPERVQTPDPYTYDEDVPSSSPTCSSPSFSPPPSEETAPYPIALPQSLNEVALAQFGQQFQQLRQTAENLGRELNRDIQQELEADRLEVERAVQRFQDRVKQVLKDPRNAQRQREFKQAKHQLEDLQSDLQHALDKALRMIERNEELSEEQKEEWTMMIENKVQEHLLSDHERGLVTQLQSLMETFAKQQSPEDEVGYGGKPIRRPRARVIARPHFVHSSRHPF